MYSKIFLVTFFLIPSLLICQEKTPTAHSTAYKKRVLESTEIDILSSYYTQDGENAAVSGGIGTENLQDVTGTIIISIPLNDDDVLTIDAGISAYTSASSSNINPFDGGQRADPFVASSGESRSDNWISGSVNYSHSSDDRNKIFSGNISVANEYDYSSLGIGGSFSHLFNEKNTEVSIKASAFFDTWTLIYPIELRPPGGGGEDDIPFDISKYTITGNPNYIPNFERINNTGRNSYSLGAGFSQILSKQLQGSLALDVVQQNGQLSTPFQRVYFRDVENSLIENFHLADDIERLPNSRLKTAAGGRLNFYLNEWLTLRSFYRYYFDDWGIQSHTASLEVPIKLYAGKFTLYPSYRFYTQTAADYFAPYNQHLSTDEFYTSDYDLSGYNAHQLGFGVSYTDILNNFHFWKLGLKSIDLKFYQYNRNSSFKSSIITFGIKFKLD